MSEKEQVSCRISDQLLHQLTRYSSKEGLKQTQVYERACEAFITWYDAQDDLSGWRARACAQTGTPYRGRLLVSVKSRLQEIGERHNHPITDMFYTALVHLMDVEALDKVELMTCFLEHSLFERCEQEVMANYADRSDFAQTVCEQYLKSRRSKAEREAHPPRESDHAGQPYPAYISSDLRHKIEEFARGYTLSPIDIYYEALSAHFRGQSAEHTTLVTGLVQESTLKLISQYIEDSSMNDSQFMESAITHFLPWYAHSAYASGSSHPLPAAPINGIPLRGYISTALAERARALPHPGIDVFSMAALHFAHVQDISRATYLFGYDDVPDKHPTGGTVKLTLLEEQNNLIRLLLIMNKLKNVSEFCNEALTWWLAHRRQEEGGYEDYFARITPGPDDDAKDFVEYNITTPHSVHSEAQLFAHEDTQSLRTVYYNATIRYLDHLLESEDVAKFVQTLSQIQPK